jgi:hypothetical protein
MSEFMADCGELLIAVVFTSPIVYGFAHLCLHVIQMY